jgi:protein-S-isoprenylcysteine O-methyltransferase Ste14
LAAAGAGGFGPFFARPSFCALIAITFVLGFVAVFTHANCSPGVREDRSNRWVLAAVGVAAIAISFLPAFTDRLGILTIDGDTTRWCGIVLFTIGGVVRLLPVFVLGSRFSGLVAIQPNHALVTTGLYRHLRHPSYLGLLITSLGWALVFRSIVGAAIALLLLVPLVGRMNAEERLLEEQFGDAYAEYRKHTWRLVPLVY